jgi:pimeloyl-ACP methyl ester carboxylesterase
VSQHAVFVPFGGEHLAAIVTAPEGDARGLVALLTGAGAPRSHRFQTWTRTAEALAGRGLASVRMDYTGMGDSTGTGHEWTWTSTQHLREQALEVIRTALRAVGADSFVAAGNCMGALLALEVAAAAPESAGALCILMPMFRSGTVTGVRHRVRRWKVLPRVRSMRLVRRLLIRPLDNLEGRPIENMPEWFDQTLARGQLRLLYGEHDWAYTARSRARISRVVGGLPEQRRAGFDVRVLPEGDLAGFESVDVQERVIDEVVEFALACFGDDRPPAARPITSAGAQGSS